MDPDVTMLQQGRREHNKTYKLLAVGFGYWVGKRSRASGSAYPIPNAGDGVQEFQVGKPNNG